MSATVHEASWRDAPGWDRVETGLDVAFKALSVEIVLVGLVAVTHLAPEAPGSAELFGWVRQILGAFTLGVTAWLIVGVARCRAVPPGGGARLAVAGALVLALAAIAAEAVLLVVGVGDLIANERAVATLHFLDRLLILGVAAGLLAAVARAAAPARIPTLVRGALLGQAVLVAFTALYAVLFLTGRLIDPTASGGWRTLIGLLALPTAALALHPLHRLARQLAQAAAPGSPIEDVSLDAPYGAVKLSRYRLRHGARSAAAAPGADDGERWIPRHERLLGLHVAREGLPERAAWVEARDGLRLYFGGLVARVAMALVAAVLPLPAFGGGPLAFFLAMVIAIGLTSGSLATALGATRYSRVPRASGAHGLARAAGLLAVLVCVGDLLVLLLLVLEAADIVVPGATEVLGVAVGAMVLTGPLVLAASLAALGRTLGERALPRRARRIGLLGALLGAMLVVSVILGQTSGSDVRGVAVVLELALFIIAIIATVQQLHLVHDGAESIDDHIARADRAADEAAAP